MPRYLLKRVWGEVSDAELTEHAQRLLVTADDDYDDISWEHSHVVVDDDGRCVSYCVYSSPDAERLLAHAKASGGHFVDEVFEIAGDVSPSDFRTSARKITGGPRIPSPRRCAGVRRRSRCAPTPAGQRRGRLQVRAAAARDRRHAL